MRLLTNNTSSKSKALVENIVNNIEGLSKPRKDFMISIMILYLSMRGRYNFKGMERYGSKCEKTYRLQFEKRFDFFQFNLQLSKAHLPNPNHCVLAFDPSYLPKSGKHTPHRGKFWSGCLGKAVQGIEIGGLGVVDLLQNTAFNLEAIQTPSPASLKLAGKTLVDHYAQVIIDREKELRTLSNYLAVDAYFTKISFVDKIVEQTKLELISKLRKDANLKYLYHGPQKGGRGRPRKYHSKVKTKKIDKRKFKWVYQDQDVIIYQAIVWSVSLKRKINVAYVEFLSHSLDDGKPTKRYALLYSTDLELNGKKIYTFYKARFQIEFLFRDAKQFTGLTHCQARSENKLHFHINTALTAVGVAKIAHYFPSRHSSQQQDNIPRVSYSISDIKTSYFNELMLDLFISNFQINPDLIKNKNIIHKLLKFGKIRA